MTSQRHPVYSKPKSYFPPSGGIPDDSSDASKDIESGTVKVHSKELKTRTVEVHNIGETNQEFLKLLLENKRKSGGGPVEDIAFVDEIATVTFKESEAAERILQKGDIVLAGKKLTVHAVKPHGSAQEELESRDPVAPIQNIPLSDTSKPAAAPRNIGATARCGAIDASQPYHIEVHNTGHLDKDILTLFFQNTKKSGGGPIKELTVEGEVAFIKFADPEVAQNVLQKAELKLGGQTLAIKAYTKKKSSNHKKPADTSSLVKSDMPVDDSSHAIPPCKVQKLHTADKWDLEVHNMEDLGIEIIRLFFENKKKSNGGRIKNIQVEDEVSFIKFEDPTVAKRVLERGTVKLGGKTLILKEPPKDPVSTSRLVKTSVPVVSADTESLVMTAAQSGNEPRGSAEWDLEIHNIGTLDEDILQLFFENKKKSKGGTISHILVENEVAFIKFEDPSVAERVREQGSLRLGEQTLLLREPQQPQERSPPSSLTPEKTEPIREIEVHNIGEFKEDLLELFFSNSKTYGGGLIEEIRIENDIGYIKFEDPAVAERVLQKRIHAFGGQNMEVKPYVSIKDTVEKENEIPDLTGDPNETDFRDPKSSCESKIVPSIQLEPTSSEYDLEVQNIGGSSEELLRLFFTNKKKSGGGEIQKSEIRGGTLYIKFVDSSVAERVLEKGTITLGGQVMDIRPFEHPAEWTAVPGIGTAPVTKGETSLGDLEPSSGAVSSTLSPKPTFSEYDVEVQNIGDTSSELLKLFFANKRKSGGGKIEHLEIKGDVAYIKFADTAVAERVLEKRKVTLGGRVMNIQPFEVTEISTPGNETAVPREGLKPSASKPVETSERRDSPLKQAPNQCEVEVHGIGDLSDELLRLFFSSKKKSGGGNVKDLKREGAMALVTFSDAKDAQNVIHRQHFKLGGHSLTVKSPANTTGEPRRSPQTDSPENMETQQRHMENTASTVDLCAVEAHNIGSLNKDILQLFFSNKKKSGGGAIEELAIEGSVARVVFKDPSVAERVLQHGELNLAGHTLTLKPCQAQKPNVFRAGTELQSTTLRRTSTAEKGNMVRVQNIGTLGKELLRLFFSNKKKSGGGEVKNLSIDGETAYVEFSDQEVTQRVLEKRELLLSGQKMVLSAQQSSALTNESSIPREARSFSIRSETTHHASASTSQASVNNDNMVIDGIEVYNIGELSAELLKLFFSNKRKSGGGEIIDINLSGGVAYIKFVNPSITMGVLKKGEVTLAGQTLVIRPWKIGLSSSSIPLSQKTTPHSTMEMDRNYVVVHGIGDLNEELLKLFFSNKKKSGGGEIKHMTIEGDAAHIRYCDPEVAKRVLEKGNLALGGKSLSIRPATTTTPATQPEMKRTIGSLGNAANQEMHYKSVDRASLASSTQGQHMCIVCFEKEIDCALYKCGHVCMCYNCAERVNKKTNVCPICQQTILDILKTFKA